MNWLVLWINWTVRGKAAPSPLETVHTIWSDSRNSSREPVVTSNCARFAWALCVSSVSLYQAGVVLSAMAGTPTSSDLAFGPVLVVLVVVLVLARVGWALLKPRPVALEPEGGAAH